jgi:hypothetical protein
VAVLRGGSARVAYSYRIPENLSLSWPDYEQVNDHYGLVIEEAMQWYGRQALSG